ncbi:MAG: PEP/pyruvate-binding domain-containing protein [Candidatus Woesearchaeota archaeon]
MANILWFKEIKAKDIPLVGGKGANLGEMFNLMPIPNGFCITVKAYEEFLQTTKIKSHIFKKLKNIDFNNTKSLDKLSKEIRENIKKQIIPKKIKEDIIKSYNELNNKYVAVRSSATAEDLPTASFAGQQDTYLNISGEKKLLEAIKNCWASLFTSRAIYYRHTNKFKHEDVKISVVVQEMIQSEKAGVMFTANPVNNKKTEMIIEGSYGLGESVVSGEVTPDTYIINKKPFEIIDISIGSKSTQITQKGKEKVSKNKQEIQLLNAKEIEEFTKIGIDIESHYKKPQDIEWAIFNNKIYILQSRPITTLK